MKNVTAIIVSYNTKDLFHNCFNSLREKYPTMPVIIVDGSDSDNECFIFARSLENKLTTVIQPGYNIGHGKGIAEALKHITTKYYLLVDSDVIVKDSLIVEEMYLQLEDDDFGIGTLIQVNEYGSNVEKGITYLHPYFALINRKVAQRYLPPYHHGAPMLQTMKDIHRCGHSHLLKHFNLDGKVLHKGRGTRALNPKEFSPGTWE